MKKKSTSNERNIEWNVKESTELLKFLFEMMPARSKGTVKGILKRGQIVVNGKPTTQFNDVLRPGDRVQLLSRVASSDAKMTGVRILHEDDSIIVVEKDAGLLTVATKNEQNSTAYRQLTNYVQSIHPKNRIFVVHRLDRDTSGVLVFAKNKDIQQSLQNAWQEVVLERTYIALVEGVVKKDGTITSWLKEDKTYMMRSSPRDNGGQKAVTHYKVLKSNRNSSLLKVNLDTGRKNQIRVHMEDLGHPIVGDKKYGSNNNIIGRLGLHAHAIRFLHPTTNESLRFVSEIPLSFTRGF